jgi:hypothetical protein
VNLNSLGSYAKGCANSYFVLFSQVRVLTLKQIRSIFGSNRKFSLNFTSTHTEHPPSVLLNIRFSVLIKPSTVNCAPVVVFIQISIIKLGDGRKLSVIEILQKKKSQILFKVEKYFDSKRKLNGKNRVKIQLAPQSVQIKRTGWINSTLNYPGGLQNDIETVDHFFFFLFRKIFEIFPYTIHHSKNSGF